MPVCRLQAPPLAQVGERNYLCPSPSPRLRVCVLCLFSEPLLLAALGVRERGTAFVLPLLLPVLA